MGLDLVGTISQSWRVNISFTKKGDWGLYTVRGEPSKAELIAACKAVCTALDVKHVVWDFTDGIIGQLSREDFTEIARAAKASIPHGVERKTAYVGPSEVVFVLLCMYSAIAVMEEIPGEFSAFRTMREAEQWLGASSAGTTEGKI